MTAELVLSPRWKELGRPAPLAEYGPYAALEKARALEPKDVLAIIKDAVLQGRGGAGFPAGMKWEFAANAPGSPKYLVCNADESEPGTFKDVQIMERDPHLLIEGMAVAARAIGADSGYIYIRGEFVRAARILEAAIAEARDIIAPFKLYVHRGAGAYICGEETALLNSLEGRIGEPRLKPPFPVTHGAWQKPTVVNNVETLSCVGPIVLRGAAWWKSFGNANGFGSKLFCVSGDVVNPGVFEAPMGTSLNEVIYNFAGGPRPGRKVKAVFPGGSSAPPLAGDELDVPMDFKSLDAKRSMLGSAGVIVVDDSRCMVDVARNVVHFYAHESCGKCTPCRDGNNMVHGMLIDLMEGRGDTRTFEYFDYMAKRIFDDCFCALAKGSMFAFGTIFRKWRGDFEAYLDGGHAKRREMWM